MVVDHNDVEREVRLLCEGALYGILNGAHTVKDWDDDGSLHWEGLLVEVDVCIGCGVDECMDGAQVVGDSLFHLYLYVAVGRIHIVELLYA